MIDDERGKPEVIVHGKVKQLFELHGTVQPHLYYEPQDPERLLDRLTQLLHRSSH